MTFIHPAIIAVAAALALSAPLSLHAQTQTDPYGEEGYYGYTPDPDGEPESVAPSRRSGTTTTATVVTSLESATKYCTLVQPKAYAIDCLAERLGELKEQLEGQEGFEEIRAVLDTASKELNDIAQENRSATLAPATFSTQGQTPVRTTRRLVPVDDARLDNAVSEALAVIVEAETLLLRSAEKSTERAVQYQRIAAAIGSNKVLLRSL